MKAAEIMTRDVATVHPDATVHEAVQLMSSRGCTSLPVLDGDNRVVGIVSEADLLRDRMPHDPRSHLRIDPELEPDPARFVRDVMNEAVVCMPASADAADIAEQMLANGIRAVPIVDGATLVGIVSRRDVLRTLLRDDKVIAAEVGKRLEEYTGAKQHWDLTVEDGVVRIYGQFSTEQLHVIDLLVRSVPGVLRVHCHHRWSM